MGTVSKKAFLMFYKRSAHQYHCRGWNDAKLGILYEYLLRNNKLRDISVTFWNALPVYVSNRYYIIPDDAGVGWGMFCTNTHNLIATHKDLPEAGE